MITGHHGLCDLCKSSRCCAEVLKDRNQQRYPEDRNIPHSYNLHSNPQQEAGDAVMLIRLLHQNCHIVAMDSVSRVLEGRQSSRGLTELCEYSRSWSRSKGHAMVPSQILPRADAYMCMRLTGMNTKVPSRQVGQSLHQTLCRNVDWLTCWDRPCVGSSWISLRSSARSCRAAFLDSYIDLVCRLHAVHTRGEFDRSFHISPYLWSIAVGLCVWRGQLLCPVLVSLMGHQRWCCYHRSTHYAKALLHWGWAVCKLKAAPPPQCIRSVAAWTRPD